MWDPYQYALFSEQRSRPFYDIFPRLRELSPATIVDLGCGTGDLTRLFAKRWPGATITGVDSSAEMLSIAASYAIPGRLSFVQADISSWTPEQPVDLLFSNAALNWLPDHPTLFPRLAAIVGRRGTFAVQMPRNHGNPSHQVIAEVLALPRWRHIRETLPPTASPVLPMAAYTEMLLERGFAVDAWETEYLHVLQGENAVLEWLKGTALRPILARTRDGEEETELLRALSLRLAEAYPTDRHGTLFPFRRLFFLATRMSGR